MKSSSAGRLIILGKTLADDDGLDRYLGELGYDVVAVLDDPAEIGSRGADSDLVLLDLHLESGQGGGCVYSRLRTEHNLPVVTVARRGNAMDDAYADAMKSYGCVHFPFEGRELQSVLQSAIVRHQVEGERRRLEQQMLAVQKSESLGVMSRHLVHDFNNRLHAVLGYIQIASMDLPRGSKSRQMLDQAVEAGMKGSTLCREFLQYSSTAVSGPPVAELSAIVWESQTLIRTIVKKNITIDYQLSTDLPHLDLAPLSVRQILFNLALNASESIGNQRGSLKIVTGHRRLSSAELAAMAGAPVRADGDYAFLQLTDDGGGISAEIAGRMFAPFFTTKFSSSGLGLTAVRDLVNLHEGAVEVISSAGYGATVSVYLPVPRKPVRA